MLVYIVISLVIFVLSVFIMNFVYKRMLLEKICLFNTTDDSILKVYKMKNGDVIFLKNRYSFIQTTLNESDQTRFTKLSKYL